MSNPHNKEIEARWLNLDAEKLRAKIREIGGKQAGSFFFKEWVFVRPEWKALNKRIRVRTDGITSWMTVKTNKTFTIDSTHEVEIEVDSADKAVELLKASDTPCVRHQEKKRETWTLGDVVMDLDFWPKIPMVFEIEAPSEKQVRDTAEALGLKWSDAVFVDQAYVHRDYYGVDLFNITDYCFDK